MRNPVTWFEIVGKDAAELHKFYKDVFDWKLTPPVAEMGNYSMLSEHRSDDRGAGGGIGGEMNDEHRVSVYVEVNDPQKYLDRAQKAGATVLMQVTQITPDTTIAMFRDPAGNVNGILKANARRPAPEAAARAASSRSRGRTGTRTRSSTVKRGRTKTRSSGSRRRRRSR